MPMRACTDLIKLFKGIFLLKQRQPWLGSMAAGCVSIW